MTLKVVTPLLIALHVVAGACSVASRNQSGDPGMITDKSGNKYKTMRMADDKYWTTENVKLDIPGSYCYDDLPSNCNRYGRLYTWKTATQVCSQLGESWRLPTNEEWKMLAKPYGGVWDDSNDNGNAAYKSLIVGGSSQFNVLLSGGKDTDGKYRRLEAHGFYWTSTETSDSTAWLYNFGSGMKGLNHHNDTEKTWAFSVRCVKGK